MDGIVGLAYESISIHNLRTFVNATYDEGSLSERTFTFYLKEDTEQSILQRPGYNRDMVYSDFYFHDVRQAKYWAISMESAYQAGKDAVDTSGYLAVIDSGTSLIMGPADIIDPIIEGIEVSKFCRNIDQLPDITFVFDGRE